ncbi:hypothetical protein [Aestuariivirga litoralis]|uniref:hypothetical protein n=1 Tax=Aestuariivirga litoralis TaxID=2650924 RepID=UPI0018C61C73|nr:hypothetical protein [Aestuariivirga litoralis]MBG1232725.1 hypothetical protein [Aestuariivirga litoralis]
MNRNDPSLLIRNTDLDAAIKAGVLDEAAATKLVDFVAQGHVALDSDNENLRLITGFNDIFVVIGLALFLGAMIGVGKGFAVYAIPFVAWGLAEVFTRRMRMALPSIVLLLVFVGSVFWLVAALLNAPIFTTDQSGGLPNSSYVVGAAVAALAAGLHWWRFHVPITFAAGAAALVGILVFGLESIFPGVLEKSSGLIFLPLGLITFIIAMVFDSRDRARRTQLSDRAFWLHLLAAPMIVHPLVWSMTKVEELSSSGAGMIIGLFVILGLVALVVDRRALLVSSLLYLGYALSKIIGGNLFGAEGASITVLTVGAVVLLLSVAWKPLRRTLVGVLPSSITKLVPLPA